jgi:hypothetical protein
MIDTSVRTVDVLQGHVVRFDRRTQLRRGEAKKNRALSSAA